MSSSTNSARKHMVNRLLQKKNTNESTLEAKSVTAKIAVPIQQPREKVSPIARVQASSSSSSAPTIQKDKMANDRTIPAASATVVIQKPFLAAALDEAPKREMLPQNVAQVGSPLSKAATQELSLDLDKSLKALAAQQAQLQSQLDALSGSVDMLKMWISTVEALSRTHTSPPTVIMPPPESREDQTARVDALSAELNCLKNLFQTCIATNTEHKHQGGISESHFIATEQKLAVVAQQMNQLESGLKRVQTSNDEACRKQIVQWQEEVKRLSDLLQAMAMQHKTVVMASVDKNAAKAEKLFGLVDQLDVRVQQLAQKLETPDSRIEHTLKTVSQLVQNHAAMFSRLTTAENVATQMKTHADTVMNAARERENQLHASMNELKAALSRFAPLEEMAQAGSSRLLHLENDHSTLESRTHNMDAAIAELKQQVDSIYNTLHSGNSHSPRVEEVTFLRPSEIEQDDPITVGSMRMRIIEDVKHMKLIVEAYAHDKEWRSLGTIVTCSSSLLMTKPNETVGNAALSRTETLQTAVQTPQNGVQNLLASLDAGAGTGTPTNTPTPTPTPPSRFLQGSKDQVRFEKDT